MLNTDVDGIKQASKGVLVSDAPPSTYEAQHRRMLEQQRDKERINMLEQDVSTIKDMLQQILNKVNQ